MGRECERAVERVLRRRVALVVDQGLGEHLVRLDPELRLQRLDRCVIGEIRIVRDACEGEVHRFADLGSPTKHRPRVCHARAAGEAPTDRSIGYARAMPVEIPTPEAINAFVAREFPSAHASGLRSVDIGPRFAVTRWISDPTTLRPGGLISGPTQFATADVALWCLTFTVLGLAPMAVTSELSIAFLRPAAGGESDRARGPLARGQVEDHRNRTPVDRWRAGPAGVPRGRLVYAARVSSWRCVIEPRPC